MSTAPRSTQTVAMYAPVSADPAECRDTGQRILAPGADTTGLYDSPKTAAAAFKKPAKGKE